MQHDPETKVERLMRELEHILDGVPTLQRALILARCFSDVYGERWIIEAKVDGRFIIQRAADAR